MYKHVCKVLRGMQHVFFYFHEEAHISFLYNLITIFTIVITQIKQQTETHHITDDTYSNYFRRNWVSRFGPKRSQFNDKRHITSTVKVIMLTCPCNVDPFIPLLYSKNRVYRGIDFFLLIFALEHRFWILVRTASVYSLVEAVLTCAHNICFEQK